MQLSEREQAVLVLLPSLLSLEEIAEDLSISVNTVKSHLHAAGCRPRPRSTAGWSPKRGPGCCTSSPTHGEVGCRFGPGGRDEIIR
ncbi:MAG: hypothetical protein JNM77_00680 [Pseudonocardia sp.]|nr:hypothetical protein [Pseudonocardia sp.]